MHLPRVTRTVAKERHEGLTGKTWRGAYGKIPNPSFLTVCVLKSCPTLRDPMDCNLLGFSVHVIFQARILEWVAISYSRDLLNPGVKPMSLLSPALAGRFFTIASPGNPEYSFFFF